MLSTSELDVLWQSYQRIVIKLQSSKMKNGKKQMPLYNTRDSVDCFDFQHLCLFSFEITPRTRTFIEMLLHILGRHQQSFHYLFKYFLLIAKIQSKTDEIIFRIKYIF